VKPETVERIIEATEAAYLLARRTLRPETERAWPQSIQERLRLVLVDKLPGYARFATWFDQQEKASELVPGWGRAVQRQHAWWWADPRPTASVYRFPNTDRTFISNVVHNAGLLMLTRYRFNYRFPRTWFLEGFAYWLELETLGYSDSFTLGRGGTGGSAGTQPLWADSDKWRDGLRSLVGEGQDPPLRRIARMDADQMGYVELVKSWSVVEMLIGWDADRFKRFVDLVKARELEEDALKEAYGVDYRGLDARWRDYVTSGFEHP
jgi:hypothetical protein